MERLKKFLKSETVLVISAIAAVVSMFFVPPSADYFSYIDFRVLALLFCLMAVVCGLRKIGVFGALAEKLTCRTRNARALSIVLLLLCFFSAMLVTNDVALITFVPFAVFTLGLAGMNRHVIFVIVMQTVAANLGSMLTPMGNPQNLYLYSAFHISIGEFFALTFPVTVISLLLILLCCLFIPAEEIKPILPENSGLTDRKKLFAYLALFLLSMGTVLHFVPYGITLAVTCMVIFIIDRSLFKGIDYGLLATFVCFFIFVGNIRNIPAVHDGIADFINGREFFASVLLSQGISNVPAAVLLSAFTDNYKALLLGTNVGGLGTLIASLASLISFKQYVKTEDASSAKYLGIFATVNFAFLAVLYCFVRVCYM